MTLTIVEDEMLIAMIIEDAVQAKSSVRWRLWKGR
jgi:hypothetical protein